MKSLILAALLVVSFNAQAEIWNLVHSQYMQGYYLCTYQLKGYQITTREQFYCPSYINN